LERRREIWAAVGPLIEKNGARNLTMRQAADASFLSLGGLYHYFPNKRALVFFGMDIEAIERICVEFKSRLDHVKETNSPEVAEAIIHFLVGMRSFVMPTVLAALELGAADSMSRLEAIINMGDMAVDAFIDLLALALPNATERQLHEVAGSMRRVRLAGLLDRSMTQSDYEEELRSVLSGAPAGRAPALAAN